VGWAAGELLRKRGVFVGVEQAKVDAGSGVIQLRSGFVRQRAPGLGQGRTGYGWDLVRERAGVNAA
jgi:hypothetical protein